MKSNIKWISIFAALCALCAIIWIARGKSGEEAVIAQIRQGDNVIRTINLSEVSEAYEFDVTDKSGGRNTIRAEHGRIAVIDADCPDRICVNQGYIDNGAVPIVCLPHKLSIIITAQKEETDAVAGAY